MDNYPHTRMTRIVRITNHTHTHAYTFAHKTHHLYQCKPSRQTALNAFGAQIYSSLISNSLYYLRCIFAEAARAEGPPGRDPAARIAPLRAPGRPGARHGLCATGRHGRRPAPSLAQHRRAAAGTDSGCRSTAATAGDYALAARVSEIPLWCCSV